MTARGNNPLNYSTTIDTSKSAAECVAMLAQHGATAIGLTFGPDKVPDGLTFSIVTVWGVRQFSLPVNMKGTEKALLKAWRERRIPQRFSLPAQAQRVAWRVLKDWLEAQLALIEAGVAELTEVMLPYIHVEPGRTLWSVYQENESKALTAGKDQS
jgi:hypothetical protein